jgi:ABC-type amino acid transport substrate-binding protein
MRRGRLILSVAGAMILSAAGAGAADPTPGLPATLRVLAAADEMPEMFSFEEKGLPGFERELLEGFCRVHGLRMEVVQVQDFDRLIPMLLDGQGDLITGIIDTAARRQRVAFSSEVLPGRHLAVARRPRPAPRAEELRALGVGVIRGTSWEQAAADAGVSRTNRVGFADAGALLAGLRAGEVDAVVMDLVDFALAQKHDPELVAGAFLGPVTSGAFAVRPGETRLLAALNSYLQGTRQAQHALVFKYLSEEALSLIALARRK